MNQVLLDLSIQCPFSMIFFLPTCAFEGKKCKVTANAWEVAWSAIFFAKFKSRKLTSTWLAYWAITPWTHRKAGGIHPKKRWTRKKWDGTRNMKRRKILWVDRVRCQQQPKNMKVEFQMVRNASSKWVAFFKVWVKFLRVLELKKSS